MTFLKRHASIYVMMTAAPVLWFCLLFPSAACADTIKGGPVTGLSQHLKDSEPILNIWYGPHQVFGKSGLPQRWINILGNVFDPDGTSKLTFSLNNGKEKSLTIGPDRRRLIAPGDFNIEIDKKELKTGLNEVTIWATDNSRNQAAFKVQIEYREDYRPLPYLIDWSRVANIQDALQIVDGLWIADGNGIRTHPCHVGYDRTVAVGDMSWEDYEVTVPFVIHAVDTSAYASSISIGPSFGINLHWLGHTDSPVTCSQPHCGWEPIGGSNWYKFRRNRDNGLRIITGPPSTSSEVIDLLLATERTYWFKVRVETTPEGNLYRLKLWEDVPGPEPKGWMLQKLAKDHNPDRGSFLLVAHHVDMTFGNVTVLPIEKESALKPE